MSSVQAEGGEPGVRGCSWVWGALLHSPCTPASAQGWAQHQHLWAGREGGFSPGAQGRNPLGFTLLKALLSPPGLAVGGAWLCL